jgi:hypothetical protein
LCCAGGKLIKYREKCVEDYEFTVKMICHECFHGFQNYAIDVQYAQWFWDDLGVTIGRVEQWRKNFSMYCGKTNSLAYKVEIVECDANAFAEDCFRQGEEVWSAIDFE